MRNNSVSFCPAKTNKTVRVLEKFALLLLLHFHVYTLKTFLVLVKFLLKTFYINNENSAYEKKAKPLLSGHVKWEDGNYLSFKYKLKNFSR